MTEHEREGVLVRLIQELRAKGSWCGETHIQKASFFLQAMCRVPTGFDFILYKHGPYSFDLTEKLTALRAEGLLELEPRAYPYGPSICPAEASKRLLDTEASAIERHARAIRFVGDALGQMSVADLERLATALYVTQKLGVATDASVRSAEISSLKPHIPVEQAKEAVSQVDELRGEYART